VVHRDNPKVACLPRLAMDPADGHSGEVASERIAAEGDNHQGLDDADLLCEPAGAGVDFCRQRIAVARRATLDDIRDEDLVPFEPDAPEQLLEELAGGADERAGLLVVVISRRFADEHYL